MNLNHAGRIMITTDVAEITYENVLQVLSEAMSIHMLNVSDCNALLSYEAGKQPLPRIKTTRPDIDVQVCDNIANEITEFWLGFGWSNPITLVQSGISKDLTVAKGVSELNNQYELARYKGKTQQFARFVEICGAGGNVLIDTNLHWKRGQSLFTYDVLDARTSFIVYSGRYTDRRRMMGVTYRHDRISGNNYFTCFTDKYRFEIENLQKIINGEYVANGTTWRHGNRSGESNPLGIVPMVEYFRAYDRSGVFERQIDEMDNLNLMISDFSNDVDQNTQAIWHGNDVDFPEEEYKDEDGNIQKRIKRPETGEWVLTYTARDGKKPFISPLAVSYDYSGMLNNILSRRQLILEKCKVPLTSETSNNSTGVATQSAVGWTAAETAAAKQQMITENCKMDEVEVVLEAIKASPYLPEDSPLKDLTIADVVPNVRRQKLYELTTKVNAIATLLSHGVYGEDVFNTIPLFDDSNETWQRSRALIEKYQESIFASNATNQGEGGLDEAMPNADRIAADLSDQIINSPLIDKDRANK